MYLVLLKFADKSRAPALMEGHNAWITAGFDAGVFLCTGSLQPGLGGAVLAHGEDRAALEARVAADPFVAEGVVTAEIHEFDARRTIPALDFLTAAA